MPTSSYHGSKKRRSDDNNENRSDRPLKRSVAFISHLLQKDLTLKEGFRQNILKIYQISSLLEKLSSEDEDLSGRTDAEEAFQSLLDSGKGAADD
jgi:hypothetical protein